MQAAEAGAPEKGVLRVATWNIAAINNNPFEYWITHDDADYNRPRPGLGCWGQGGWRVLHTTHGDVRPRVAPQANGGRAANPNTSPNTRLMEGVQSFIDEPGACAPQIQRDGDML